MNVSPRKFALALLLLLAIASVMCSPSVIEASSSTGTKTLAHLENTPSRWHIFQDQGHTEGTIRGTKLSNITGNTLAISLIGGQPYAGFHAYRNFAPTTANTFEVNLSFEFPDAAPVQALEFTTSKWEKNQRWEWAFQWEHVGDGGPQQGIAPSWRLWSGSVWLNTGLTQQLTPGTWHTLHFTGTIANGNVLYTGFQCDDILLPLAQTFAPVPSQGNKVAIGVQLDGNRNEDRYQLYVNQVSLSLAKL